MVFIIFIYMFLMIVSVFLKVNHQARWSRLLTWWGLFLLSFFPFMMFWVFLTRAMEPRGFSMQESHQWLETWFLIGGSLTWASFFALSYQWVRDQLPHPILWYTALIAPILTFLGPQITFAFFALPVVILHGVMLYHTRHAR